MDHHCPWIGTCVGYHNIKPFFLFCFYQACSGVVFATMLVLRILNSPDDAPPFSRQGEACFWVAAVLDMPICFALIGLSINFFLQLYENQMTLETFGKHGKIQRRYPCYGIPRSHGLFQPNAYDILWPNNLRQVFGSNILLWGVPFYQPEMKGRGFYFPKIPEVNSQDVGILQRDGKINKKSKYYDPYDQFNSKNEDYVAKAKEKYRGYSFLLPSQGEGEESRVVQMNFNQ